MLRCRSCLNVFLRSSFSLQSYLCVFGCMVIRMDISHVSHIPVLSQSQSLHYQSVTLRYSLKGGRHCWFQAWVHACVLVYLQHKYICRSSTHKDFNHIGRLHLSIKQSVKEQLQSWSVAAYPHSVGTIKSNSLYFIYVTGTMHQFVLQQIKLRLSDGTRAAKYCLAF